MLIRRPEWALGSVRHFVLLWYRCCRPACRQRRLLARGASCSCRTAALSHLLQKLHQQGRFLLLDSVSREASSLAELLSRNDMLLALHCDLWQVHRHRVVHLVVLQVLFDEQSNQFAVRILVNLAGYWVLPLEARRLLGVRVSVVLDRLEDLCT